MKRIVAAVLLAVIASAHGAFAQAPPQPAPPAPPAQVPMEALQECQDFTYSLRTQREQVMDAAAAAHTQLTRQARTIVALQQEVTGLKAELAKARGN